MTTRMSKESAQRGRKRIFTNNITSQHGCKTFSSSLSYPVFTRPWVSQFYPCICDEKAEAKKLIFLGQHGTSVMSSICLVLGLCVFLGSGEVVNRMQPLMYATIQKTITLKKLYRSCLDISSQILKSESFIINSKHLNSGIWVVQSYNYICWTGIYLQPQHYSETSYYMTAKLSSEWFWINLATVLQLIPLCVRTALGALYPTFAERGRILFFQLKSTSPKIIILLLYYQA